MFDFHYKTNWKDNLKDKMITFIDLYRKNYKEPIKDIKYKRTAHDDYRMVITYVFNCVEITFECVETENSKWISIFAEISSDDKNYFDNRYEFIKNTIKEIEGAKE